MMALNTKVISPLICMSDKNKYSLYTQSLGNTNGSMECRILVVFSLWILHFIDVATGNYTEKPVQMTNTLR